jgi:hypothetical protein
MHIDATHTWMDADCQLHSAHMSSRLKLEAVGLLSNRCPKCRSLLDSNSELPRLE